MYGLIQMSGMEAGSKWGNWKILPLNEFIMHTIHCHCVHFDMKLAESIFIEKCLKMLTIIMHAMQTIKTELYNLSFQIQEN